MEKINFSDINLQTLQKLKQQGTKATIYRNDKNCYKILDGLYEEEKELLYRKFMEMDGLKIENVLLPKQLIIQDGKLKGYIMDFFDDSIPLSDRFLTRYVDCKQLFEYVYKASKILRTIHENDIICQDLSFENILVDRNGSIAFCDLDGCSYKKHKSPFISILMKYFLVDYRKDKIILSSDLDRISMMISLYYLMYLKEIQNLSKREYNKLSKKIITLENMKVYANMLVDTNNPIGEIPYLDELIDLNDNYIIDRENQLTFVDKILRNKRMK